MKISALVLLCLPGISSFTPSSHHHLLPSQKSLPLLQNAQPPVRPRQFTTLQSSNTSSEANQQQQEQQQSYAAPLPEINRRRNLAIISHPDSGKTTMTEKLLLYGGAIQQAGAVRQKAEQRGTASDFMEMERERGISISSTVMNFDYDGLKINILDTPGHEDFSEDTYRALAAADNAVMLLGE